MGNQKLPEKVICNYMMQNPEDMEEFERAVVRAKSHWSDPCDCQPPDPQPLDVGDG